MMHSVLASQDIAVLALFTQSCALCFRSASSESEENLKAFVTGRCSGLAQCVVLEPSSQPSND